MADRTDAADRLREIGRRDTPPLDDERLEAIEARVMATVTSPLALEPAAPSDGGRRRLAPMVAVAAALILVAVLGAVALAGRGGEGLVIEAASGVVIVAPDAEPVTGVSGDRLADGMVVEIDPGGSATVDGVVYGPGRYVVDGGNLRSDPPGLPPAGDDDQRPVPAASTSSSSPPSTTTIAPSVTRPATTSTFATNTVTSYPTRNTTATTIAAPSAPTTPVVGPTEPPRATRPPSTDPTSGTRPERATTTTMVTVTSTRPPVEPTTRTARTTTTTTTTTR